MRQFGRFLTTFSFLVIISIIVTVEEPVTTAQKTFIIIAGLVSIVNIIIYTVFRY